LLKRENGAVAEGAGMGHKGGMSWSPRTWKFNRRRTKLNDRASCLRRKAQTWQSGRREVGCEGQAEGGRGIWLALVYAHM